MIFGRVRAILGLGEDFDEPLKEQQKSVVAHFERARLAMGLESRVVLQAEADQVSGGVGPFGFCASNPIPVNGPEGEVVYLERLRTHDGNRLLYHRISCEQGQNSHQPVDCFDVLSDDGKVRCRIYFNCYFPRRSRMCPDGFALRRWASMSKLERLIMRVGLSGTTTFVADFPDGLVVEVRDNCVHSGLSPAATQRVCEALQRRIDRARKKA